MKRTFTPEQARIRSERAVRWNREHKEQRAARRLERLAKKTGS